jgi:hypothetical protein
MYAKTTVLISSMRQYCESKLYSGFNNIAYSKYNNSFRSKQYKDGKLNGLRLTYSLDSQYCPQFYGA